MRVYGVGEPQSTIELEVPYVRAWAYHHDRIWRHHIGYQ
jgi:hypothetical protein